MNEQKPPSAGEPRKSPLEGRFAPPTPSPGQAPAPKPQPASSSPDPRKASDLRKPGSVAPQAPKPQPVAEFVEEDPEKLLREYAERQKTKIQRLEQQLAELKKVQSEREAYRIKGEALARELTDARRQLEASSKADAVIKDLQGKVDAAILSSSMEKEEIAKLRAKAESLEAALKKSEERAGHFERVLSEAQKQLVVQTEGRREAEARVAAALQALHGEVSKSPTVKIPSSSDGASAAPAPQTGLRHAEATPVPQTTRPAPQQQQHAAAHAAVPKPGLPVVRK